tara:strand:+ start:564 stop:1388 length:825 start_codon:yes stop_codon:yes gene_type:complete
MDIYRSRLATEFYNNIEISEAFEMIRTQRQDLPKDKRVGIVYSTTSSRGRKHDDILSYTGMAFIDVDECTDSQRVKEILADIDCTIACWYSTSGNVHALVKIPVCESKDEFKRRYKILQSDLEALIGDLGKFDGITCNPTQLAFISSDKDIYVNDNPKTYNGIYEATPREPSRRLTFSASNSDASSKWCINKANEWFTNISSNGYPQVLRYSYALGGYSGAGYISEDTSLEVIRELIKNNSYLNSDESSGSLRTYLNGAESSFKSGTSNPIEWN